MKNNKLKKINGTRIRLQYFNGYLVFVSLMLSIAIVYGLFYNKIDEMPVALFTVAKMLSPVIILSIANRFLFGRVVCVVNKDGLFCEKASVLWSEFEYVILDLGMALPTRSGMNYSSVTFVAKDFKMTVDKAPLYLLRYVKKYKRGVKITLTDGSKFLIKLVIAALAIGYAAIILFEK